MNHPQRYTDDDPCLLRLRKICLALPGAVEKQSHGRPIFHTVKTFAIFGGAVKGDHVDDRWSQSVQVLVDESERAALLHNPRFFTAAYYGPHGWIGLNFRSGDGPADPGTVDWVEVAELVELSFRTTAPAKLIRALDSLALRP